MGPREGFGDRPCAQPRSPASAVRLSARHGSTDPAELSERRDAMVPSPSAVPVLVACDRTCFAYAPSYGSKDGGPMKVVPSLVVSLAVIGCDGSGATSAA